MIFALEDLDNFNKFNEDLEVFESVNIKDTCVELAKAEWPDIDIKSEFTAKNWPIKDGDALAKKREAKKKNGDHYKGLKVIRGKASKEYPPRLYYTEEGKSKLVARGLESDENKAKSLFTGGNYAYAEVTVKPNELNDDKYITFYLNSVKFVKTGERLGGQSMLDRFEGIMGGVSDHDPTAGMDDEIDF